MDEGAKSPGQIRAMIDELEDNIRANGWDPAVDAAAAALAWVLNEPLGDEARLRMFMERPESDRRSDWIARGGDPAEWKLGADEDVTGRG